MATETVNNRRIYEFSSDSNGIFGNLKNLKQRYDYLLNDPCFRIEIIFWKWLANAIESADVSDLPIGGYHARMGSGYEPFSLFNLKSQIRQGGLNWFLMDTKSMLTRYNSKDRYILFHGPEAYYNLDLIKQSDFEGTIYIENHTEKGSVQLTHNVVQELRQSNKRAFTLFDIYHGFGEFPDLQTYESKYKASVELLSQESVAIDKNGELFLGAVHVPIGADTGDSIRMLEMNLNDWILIANAIPNPSVRVIFENQHIGSRFRVSQDYKNTLSVWDRCAIGFAHQSGIITLTPETENGLLLSDDIVNSPDVSPLVREMYFRCYSYKQFSSVQSGVLRTQLN